MAKFFLVMTMLWAMCTAVFAAAEYEAYLKQERESQLNAYLETNPLMKPVAARLEASYYIDLSAFTFKLDEDIVTDEYFSNLLKLYEENCLEIERGIPVVAYIFTRYNEGGNSFLNLIDELTQTPFASGMPQVKQYYVSINDHSGNMMGNAFCYLAEDEVKTLIVFPWNGNDISSYTLKLSEPLLEALAQSNLDLAEVKAHSVSFSGVHGAIFYDQNNAYFTPVMTEDGISAYDLNFNQLYPLVQALKTIEKGFAS